MVFSQQVSQALLRKVVKNSNVRAKEANLRRLKSANKVQNLEAKKSALCD